VYIEGRMQTRSTGNKIGVKRYRTEIVADTFQFGADGGKGGGESNTVSSSNSESIPNAPKLPDYPEEEINPDDIPF